MFSVGLVVPSYYCLSHPPAFYISTAIITIVTDVLALLIPLRVLVRLNIRLGTKLRLIVVFLGGGV